MRVSMAALGCTSVNLLAVTMSANRRRKSFSGVTRCVSSEPIDRSKEPLDLVADDVAGNSGWRAVNELAVGLIRETVELGVSGVGVLSIDKRRDDRLNNRCRPKAAERTVTPSAILASVRKSSPASDRRRE